MFCVFRKKGITVILKVILQAWVLWFCIKNPRTYFDLSKYAFHIFI